MDKGLKLQHIGSSNIWRAGYSKEKRELVMVFINRKTWTYTYYNVPIRVWVNFLKSASKGIYFTTKIKEEYQYKKVTKNT